MNQKAIIFILMTVGSLIGSCIPYLWGAGTLSVSSLFFGSVGAIAGIYFGYKISRY